MPLSATPRQAVLLLAAGAVAFALVGWRVLTLEQTEGERRAMRRSGLAVARAKADADRLASAPRGSPLASWRIEPGTTAGAGGADGILHWDHLRRVAGHEGRPNVALQEYEALLHPTRPRWVRSVAALRMGNLLATLGRLGEAELRWTEATEAGDLQVGLERERVRLMALRQLAAAGIARGDPVPLRRLLKEAQDGMRVVRGEADPLLGPARLVVALADSLSASAWAGLDAADRQRLLAAATHAKRGLTLMSVVSIDGRAFVDGHVVWRQGAHLLVFPLSSLVEPALAGFESGFVLEPLRAGAPLPVGSLRLAAPLQGLIVRPVPWADETRIGIWMALALGIGLLAYGIGAAVALAGWRRSSAVAVQQADFTAAVSHEMKTPIASVRAMAELLGDGGVSDPEQVQRYMRRIEAEMQRLGSTVRNVLDAANVERGALAIRSEPGDPAALLERVAAVVRPALEARGFEFRLDAEPAPGPVAFDAHALEGVLMNLLDNAAKFSVDPLRIGLRGEPRSAGGYRITVVDRGVGLGSGDADSLFLRYHRGSAAREGAVPGVGLGLHIAREVIEAHGGHLSARNRSAGGSAFVIDLPGAPPDEPLPMSNA